MKSLILSTLLVVCSSAAYSNTSITKEEVKAATNASLQIKQVVDALKTQENCTIEDDITLKELKQKTRYTIQVRCDNGSNTEDMQFIVFKGMAYRNGEKVELDLSSISLHYLND